ncbi:hypothetical protein SAMN05421823_109252 [Catalinimonas alkaloidigena]|uniref:Uncharacterized protein n=1 Tax=Catalinimonas alkaloidigena TaxID=1075417 RepID=A0A1G9PNY4_9BACT|nr:hypothetical protein [Catalinimonas alkaloidigena]SDM00434.1 hypothetical protein SAMN05421823_109252 [Catalinimonas alkaloidigena]
MKHVFYVAVLLALCSGCHAPTPQPEVCGTPNPMDELAWLNARRETWLAQEADPGLTICWVDFKGQTAIWLYSPIFSSFPNLYTCSGELIEVTPDDQEAMDRFSRMLQNKTICHHLIWASPNASFCK